MRSIKISLAAVLATGLLAGSAVAVAAQGGVPAPTEFTGATSFGACTALYCDNPIVEPFTDPRLAGRFRVWQNNDAYPAGPTLYNTGFSMRDDEGGWIQRPSLAISYPDGTDATKVIVMDGQGGYAGLTVVAEVRLDHGRWDWHGYILDGDLPPAPTIELAE